MAKGAERSGRYRIGFERKRDFRVSKEV